MSTVTSRQTARHRTTWIAWIVCCLCCVLFMGAHGWAQADQGTITGVVQDSTGAVLAGAPVTLTSMDTGLVLQAKTDRSGVYTFSPVKIGNYKVAATSAGFQTTSQEHVHLDVQQRLNVPLTLKIGEASQVLTVTSEIPLLQTQDSSVGQVVDTQTINDTPLNGRNWVYIAQLTAGTEPTVGSRAGGKGDFEANGQRAEQNNFVLDGVDNNVNVIDFLGGSSLAVRPPPDALAEFKVQTSDYSAEFGHSAGAVLNASIKAGTNQIHGDMWEYFRNDVLDARDFDSLVVPKYRQNQFGATLGLPIIKNKLFFFGDIEANRIVFGTPYTVTVPTALMRQGNFSELLNQNLTGANSPIQLYQPNSGGTTLLQCGGQQNVFCSGQINPLAQKILNLFPLPNTNGGLTYNNYKGNSNSTDDTIQWDSRIDWTISQKDQAFVRLSYAHEYGYQAPPLGPILDGGTYAADGTQINLAENIAISETHIFSPTLTNEARFGFNYGHFGYLQPNSQNNISAQLGLGGIPFQDGYFNNGGLPSFYINGLSSFGASTYYPVDEHQDVGQYLDNVTKIIGNHTLKAGVDFQSIRNDYSVPADSRGFLYYDGIYTSNPASANPTGYGVADFMADQMNFAQLSNQSRTADARWYRAAYVQDDWKVTNRLTLNLGLRYEYYQPNEELANAQANFFVNGATGPGFGQGVFQLPSQDKNVFLAPLFTQTLATDNIALQYVNNRRLVTSPLANWAPRVGLAYSPLSTTVIRAGFGMFYGGLESVGANPNMGSNYPFQFLDNFNPPACGAGNCPSSGITLKDGFSQALSQGIQNFISVPGFTGIDPHLKIPYTMGYNLTIEQSIGKNMVASVGYVGNVARHLGVYVDVNAPKALLNPGNPTLTSQNVRPFPDFGGTTYTSYSGVSTYNALQTKFEKRFSRGLSFLATYTWSHALDDAQTPLTPLANNTDSGYRNTALIPVIDDYSNSPWDTRHRFTLNGLYELPFGTGRSYAVGNRFADTVAGGWSTSLTFAAQSGNPFSVYPDIPTAQGGYANAILVGNPFAAGGSADPSNTGVTCATQTHTLTNWYNPCAFANPIPGNNIPLSGPGQFITSMAQAVQYLGGRRLQIYGPGYERINMSIFKNFTTWHEQYLQFRTDIFNVLNTPAYGQPSAVTNASNGGQITTARFFQNFTPDARFFQFSLKYVF
jgi:hypothetical protein